VVNYPPPPDSCFLLVCMGQHFFEMRPKLLCVDQQIAC